MVSYPPAKCISQYAKKHHKKSLPNVDKVMMMISDCGHEDRIEPPLRHVLFPSRSPPPLTKSPKNKKSKYPSLLALTTESFAAAKIAPVSNATAKSSPPKRSLRQTLHRRNYHVFASSHSPTKSSASSSASPKTRGNAKASHTRKHHRRHNFALNAMDFEVLLGK